MAASTARVQTTTCEYHRGCRCRSRPARCRACWAKDPRQYLLAARRFKNCNGIHNSLSAGRPESGSLVENATSATGARPARPRQQRLTAPEHAPTSGCRMLSQPTEFYKVMGVRGTRRDRSSPAVLAKRGGDGRGGAEG